MERAGKKFWWGEEEQWEIQDELLYLDVIYVHFNMRLCGIYVLKIDQIAYRDISVFFKFIQEQSV